MILPEIREDLWAYMGGIARDNRMEALAVGGTEDHVHLLLSLPATISIAKAVQLIKGASSRWVRATFEQAQTFAWQEGYGVFSVNISAVKKTIRYIEQQAEHHRDKSFQEEYVGFLKKHGIDYDERYVWG
ncbi:MAG: IS200/IS605 family transposase [Thermodesulfobacteriota bacterium]|nr:IS200/IS605 family transposase [Thermodesulfobacteriota bacterium]